MKTPISIITGYLGSGKTTLLKKIVGQTNKKIAILMNEFGEVGIDSKIIKGKNINMVELAGGCVCCSLTGEFEFAVKEILQKIKPDMIIVETTGVAEPDALVFDIEENLPEVKLDSIITIVDADGTVRFPSLGETGRIQIEIADIILINKIDLVNQKQLKQVEKKIRELNENAIIMKTVKCDVDIHVLFGLEVERHLKEREHEHEDIESFTYTTKKTFDPNKFKEFVSNIPKQVYRAKGFVVFEKESFLFDYVAGRWTLEKFNIDKAELVFIGGKITKVKNKIVNLLKRCEI